ncbi:MAG: DUF4280 domain-containing protein [Oscillospiraceae bacterium]
MGLLVTNGAQLKCSFGMAPSVLIVPPANKVLSGTPAANIMDIKPIGNIPPFGMCQTLSNPAVAAATASALGVLTPSACVPVISTPWMPGSSTVLIGNMPALNDTCTLMCMYGGVIQIISAGQTGTQVGN